MVPWDMLAFILMFSVHTQNLYWRIRSTIHLKQLNRQLTYTKIKSLLFIPRGFVVFIPAACSA